MTLYFWRDWGVMTLILGGDLGVMTLYMGGDWEVMTLILGVDLGFITLHFRGRFGGHDTVFF